MISPGWEGNHHVDVYRLSLVGRLKPDASRQRVEAMLLPLYRAELQDQLPRMEGIDQNARKKILAKPLTLQPAAQGINQPRAEWQTPLAVLTVMVGLVLLIACANVANLLVERATARQREISIRLAVGATRWQLVRQLMVESGGLAMAGGLLGLFLSENLTDGLLNMLPTGATGGWLAPQLNIRLLCHTMALSLLTGLLFGLAPALHALRSGVAPALKAQTTGMSASGSHSRTRQALMVVQICVSLLLLTGAALFTRSLWNLMRSDPGFRADHMVTFTIDPSLSGYNLERRLALFHALQERLSSLPGVKSRLGPGSLPSAGLTGAMESRLAEHAMLVSCPNDS